MMWQQMPRPPLGALTDDIVLRLLGHFSLSVNGVARELPVQAQKVIAFLALHTGPQPRERVAGQVWVDADLKRCKGSLRTVLWQVRRVSPDLVQAQRGSIALGSSVRVDLHEGWAVVKSILDGRPVDPDHALSLLAQRLLPDWDDEWSLLEQERVQQMYVHCLEALSHQLVNEKQYAYAMQAARAACRIEPLRESAQRAFIDIHLAEGNHAQARRVFEDFRRLLQSELGVEPSAQLVASLTARTRSLHRGRPTGGLDLRLPGERARELWAGSAPRYRTSSLRTGGAPDSQKSMRFPIVV
jgi:DNA-binding SARP family transcriptional activator